MFDLPLLLPHAVADCFGERHVVLDEQQVQNGLRLTEL
jgi:hypothetical protein